MKNEMRWYAKGSRPQRNWEAATYNALHGYLTAIAEGKPRPWLYAAGRAVASATAMNEHRLVSRTRANERNTQFADLAIDALNAALESPTRVRQLDAALPAENQVGPSTSPSVQSAQFPFKAEEP